MSSNKKDGPSDDSDGEYVPLTKRSKSTNSESDHEPELDVNDKKHNSLDKSTLDVLWQEFKQDTTPLSSRIIPTKVKESNSPEGQDRDKLDILNPQKEDNGYRICRDAPKKSRLKQLLTSRGMEKRQKPENILNSSKRDWESVKVREDLSEELIHHNKDGFIERQEFLRRCEEREHDTLLGARKRRK